MRHSQRSLHVAMQATEHAAGRERGQSGRSTLGRVGFMPSPLPTHTAPGRPDRRAQSCTACCPPPTYLLQSRDQCLAMCEESGLQGAYVETDVPSSQPPLCQLQQGLRWPAVSDVWAAALYELKYVAKQLLALRPQHKCTTGPVWRRPAQQGLASPLLHRAGAGGEINANHGHIDIMRCILAALAVAVKHLACNARAQAQSRSGTVWGRQQGAFHMSWAAHAEVPRGRRAGQLPQAQPAKQQAMEAHPKAPCRFTAVKPARAPEGHLCMQAPWSGPHQK